MNEEVKEVNKEAYHKVTGKMFTNSLVNIPLFAVPAFAALFIGKYFDAKYETGKAITLSLLFIAFTTSWVLVLRNSRKIANEYRQVRKEMKSSENQNTDKSA